MTVRVGCDTGGTFTDFVRVRPDGNLEVHKVRSVPSDPSRAILQGLAEMQVQAGAGSTPSLDLTHGSTVATNAVLERKGARAALVVTAGFEDVLRIGRQTRSALYDFQVEAPRPLIDPSLVFGVQERTLYDGSVLQPLNPAELMALIPRLHAAEVWSVAICFLHCYANPTHEAEAAKILRAAGFLVSASSEVLPEYREFERWSTTAVNAYVAPLMDAYLTRLEVGLAGPPGDEQAASLRIMQSNGGSISAARAKREAVQTILSGPAAGVVGAQAYGEASGHSRLIAFDMGGTSTDVSLIDGMIGTTVESLVGDLPVRLPVLDIHTVGAGGGSVAWIDSGGSLRVGPRSAGADPGPACYGKGEELTVTDAHLLLGRLQPEYFLGGRMHLDYARAERAAARLAEPLGLSVRALAEGVLRIADANMERAIRVVSVERGHDPRDFALLAFGGAGGLHGCSLADRMEMHTVLIPEHSGVLSALGMLLADMVKDYSASVLGLSLVEETLRHMLEPLRTRACTDLAAEGFAAQQVTLQPSLAMRYVGQAYELDVPFHPGADAAAEFHSRHARRYGYSDPARPVEAVQLRLRAIGHTTKPDLPMVAAPSQALPEPDAVRQAVFAGSAQPVSIWQRSRLEPGMGGAGPAIVITGESTNVVAPGWRWQIDGAGTLVLHREGSDAR